MTKTIAVAGHNSIDGGKLKSFVDRLERLDEERAGIVGDMKDVREEAKKAGFDVKTIQSILRLRRKETAVRQAEIEMLEAYMAALGM